MGASFGKATSAGITVAVLTFPDLAGTLGV
jgi:hypothetical protein